MANSNTAPRILGRPTEPKLSDLVWPQDLSSAEIYAIGAGWQAELEEHLRTQIHSRDPGVQGTILRLVFMAKALDFFMRAKP